jgi:mannose-6-phosphate isomerase
MERIWGGRRLETEFGKKLPPDKSIGESWEMVDRPEARSAVANAPLKGKTLHDLWTQDRSARRTDSSRGKQLVFGNVPDSDRFPLLVKLLDAHDKLSLQVHPTEEVAKTLGGEAKTEFWYVAAAGPEAEIFVGLRKSMTRAEFRQALERGEISDHVHRIRIKPGDAMFLPAGRFHAVGAGALLIEIQQNSDTTYRVFDWNRVDESGKPRKLHIDEALQSIDFNDVAPTLIEPKGELLVQHNLFEIRKWNLDRPREIASHGQFAIVCCLTGSLRCADVDLAPGGFFLVPAALQDRQLHPRENGTSLLRVTIPM